jgi:hypothetical protein
MSSRTRNAESNIDNANEKNYLRSHPSSTDTIKNEQMIKNSNTFDAGISNCD